MSRYVRYLGLCCLALGFIVAGQSYAQNGEPRLLSKYGDWSAYMFIENGSKVCYMISQPKTAQGNYSKRGKIYALVTNRPAEGTRDVFSYITGYGYKAGSDATLEIDGTTYTLFTQDETAWAPDAATDKQIARAIRDGSRMVVKGVSSRGTKTTDTFSLKGSSKAYKRMSDEC
ncbi:MAG: invasion associated locus B family protein [Bdellovibrionales bacterium]